MILSNLKVFTLVLFIGTGVFAKNKPVEFCQNASDLRECLNEEAEKSRRKLVHTLNIKKTEHEFQQDYSKLETLQKKEIAFNSKLKKKCFADSNYASSSAQLLCEVSEIRTFIRAIR